MKKIFRISLIGLASVFMYACSSDEPVSTSTQQDPAFEGEKAYLNVRLATPGSDTRGSDGGYKTFDLSEGWDNVKTADFLFYNASGEFVCKSSIWNGGGLNSDDPNIDFDGSSVVLLDGVTVRPSYVFTLINAPEDYREDTFSPATISDLLSYLADGFEAAEDYRGRVMMRDDDDAEWPIMTTSSYIDAANDRTDTNYFLTKVSPDMYKNTKEQAEAEEALTIYVERLAALVTVGIDNLEAEAATIDDESVSVYQPEDLKITGVEDGQVYIELYGFDVNAVAKNSYLVKHINKDWNFGDWSWNKASDFRSFWAQAYTYVTSATGTDFPDKYAAEGFAPKLDYVPFGSLGTATVQDDLGCDMIEPASGVYQSYGEFGKYLTLAENTNCKGIVSNYPNAITNVLVKARLVEKQTDGTFKGIQAVKYNGKLYTQAKYLEHVFNTLSGQGKLPYKIGGVAMTANDLTLVSSTPRLNGRVKVALKSSVGAITDSEGKTVTAATVNGILGAYNSENEAQGYRDGYMYYTAPIEHLNNAAKDSNGEIPEGKYGIVRNHIYSVSINSIKGEGTGVWEPTEPIVPNPQDDTYSLDATIKILSWQVVESDMDF